MPIGKLAVKPFDGLPLGVTAHAAPVVPVDVDDEVDVGLVGEFPHPSATAEPAVPRSAMTSRRAGFLFTGSLLLSGPTPIPPETCWKSVAGESEEDVHDQMRRRAAADRPRNDVFLV